MGTKFKDIGLQGLIVGPDEDTGHWTVQQHWRVT